MTRTRTTTLMTIALASAVLGGAAAAPALPAGTATRGHEAGRPGGGPLRPALAEVVATGVPGVIARVEHGREVRALAAGVADVSTGAPLRPGARFRAGSTTKTFVATVVLQLVGEGRLALDEPVAHRLPGLLPDGEAITVRHLLNHSSGLADYTADPTVARGIVENRVFRPRELAAVAVARPLDFAPGTKQAYSNSNYVIAGLLVESVTGHSLGHELRHRIVEPLNLDGTSFPLATRRIAGGHARGYLSTDLVTGPGGRPLDVTETNPSWAWAAGALVTNARDLSRFYRSLLGGRLLGPALLAEMTTPFGDPAEPDNGWYGLGLYRIATPCGTFWGHNGGMPGYHTEVFADERGRRSVVLAATMGPFPPAAAQAPFFTALEVALCGRHGPGFHSPRSTHGHVARTLALGGR